MSRKDYRSIASALASTKPTNKAGLAYWACTVAAIADALAADNGRFDRDRFYRACGLDQ